MDTTNKKQIANDAISLLDNAWTMLLTHGLDATNPVVKHAADVIHTNMKTMRSLADIAEVSDRLIGALNNKVKNLEEIQAIQAERIEIRDNLIAIKDKRIELYQQQLE